MSAPSVLNLLEFVFPKRVPVILQSEATECGLACLAMIASYHGLKTDLHGMRQRVSISLTGTTLKGIMAAGSAMDLACRPLRLELEALGRIRRPAILHWDMNHFVVLTKVSGEKVRINDPAVGERELSIAEVSAHFSGVALELMPTPNFRKRDETERMRIADVVGNPKGLIPVLFQIFLLSVVLQLVAIAGPFYNQIVVDEVLTRFDANLLPVLAIGFGILKLINMATSALRSYIQLYLGSTIGYQLEVNLFSHLMRLPMPFFEKRHIGDIVSRFASTDPINQLLTHGIVGSIVDGLLAITTLVLIFYYSLTLALVVVGALFLYSLYRVVRYRYLRLQSQEQIQAKAKESTNFQENVRAARAIKIFSREVERQSIWQNLYSATVNIGFRVNRANILFTMANDLFFGIEEILVIYLAARMILDGSFTIGMMFAFLSYRDFFVSKSLSVVQTIIDFRMLDIHLSRLADIGLTAKEKGIEAPAVRRNIAGAVALSDVSFRYGDTEPFIFENLSFAVEPGECVAITGPSGCGKTTMMKVMLGLVPPTSGHLLIDGQPLSMIGLQTFRHAASAVMQDDHMMSGSVADNIAFFDPDMDFERIQQCAQIAAVHDDIMRMPMGYNTLTGDMGTVLSGGQKQRILLARALYARPKILMLDEGTAHLDLHTEKIVNDAVASLNMTRIIIAHRPHTIASADRIVRLEHGTIRPVTLDPLVLTSFG
ncbi:MAG TPA: peptidase domain-containing ABC transporter [Alphaproteobacteria bacterium]|nr:peptidase domain-containing ABC transporter [Alphaproteobacteria bacterium]